jgi:NAD(P)-dependent dehydrogenase (short-subunit alcohol dehydrogenase family)
MRERNSGCIINIGSRAGTVNAPFATPYFTSKAGLLRVTACLQLEQEMDGITGVSFYCLHPGGVRTHSHTDPSTHTLTMTLTEDAYADDVREKYPEIVAWYQEFQKRFIDSGYLCGQTCAFIAAGRALPLRGKYFDVEQDISKVLEYAPEFAKKGLYDLKVEFAGGLLNDGGTTADTMSQKQQKK